MTTRPIGGNGILLMLLAVLTGALAVGPLREWGVLVRLRDHGLQAPARITRTSIDASARRSTDVVWYEFERPDGTVGPPTVERFRRTRWFRTDPLALSRAFTSDALQARYLPRDPGVHRLDVALPGRIAEHRFRGLLLGGLTVALAVAGARVFQRDRAR